MIDEHDIKYIKWRLDHVENWIRRFIELNLENNIGEIELNGCGKEYYEKAGDSLPMLCTKSHPCHKCRSKK